jgi:YVTN family beta-propeller protein
MSAFSNPHRSVSGLASRLCRAAVLLLASAFAAAPAAAQWCEELIETIHVAPDNESGALAVDPATRLVWVARKDAGGPDFLSTIDADFLIESSEDAAGPDPEAIALNPITHRVYVANSGDDTISVIDGDPASPTFRDEIASIPTSLRPVGLAVDPVDGLLFADTGEPGAIDGVVVAIDETTLTVVDTLALPGEARRDTIEIDPVLRRVFVARGENITGNLIPPALYAADIDGASGPLTSIGSVPYPDTAAGHLTHPTGLTIDRLTQRAYVFGGDGGLGSSMGRLEVIDTLSLTSIEGLAVSALGGEYGMVVDPSRNRLILPVEEGPYEIALLDGSPLAEDFNIQTDKLPTGSALDPVTHRVLVMGNLPSNWNPHGARIDVIHAPDPDADAIGSSCDNCPGDYNPDQADSDGDGAGDACDPNDDGDGCSDAIDDDDFSTVQVIGGWISESCNPRSGTEYGSTSVDSDGDGQLDCSDDDDDNDGTPDVSDACPVDPGLVTCIDFVSCGLQLPWDICQFGGSCRELLLKVIAGVNPDPTIVFSDVEILNRKLFLKVPAGTSVPDAANALASLGGGGFAMRGASTITLELWRKETRSGPEEFVATVMEYEPSQVVLGHVSNGRWLELVPPVEGDTRLGVAATWVEGAPAGTPFADYDGDDTPNAYDGCLLVKQAPAIDTDGDEIGNACDADYDGSGVVDDVDARLLELRLGLRCGDDGFDADLDSNDDCVIDSLDEALYTAQENGPPGPSGLTCPPGARGVCDAKLPRCANGQDDDGDGRADFPADGGCASAADPSEQRPACGLGTELALLLAMLRVARRRAGGVRS